MASGAHLSWVSLALASAACTTARHCIVKYRCRETPPEALIFSTRLIGALALAPAALARGVHIGDASVFWPFAAVTIVITAGATMLQIDVIQKEALSRSVPFLSFIPIFMIPWTVLLFGEYPSPRACVGIAAACMGAWLLNCRRGEHPLTPLKSALSYRGSRLMLGVALALGLTTACDKAAIGASSGITYAFVWAAVSTVVMGALAARRGVARAGAALLDKYAILQAVFWAAAFGAQMSAIQAALDISSGVTYVKTLTMVNIVLTVGIGGALGGERRLVRAASASALMTAGAALVAFQG
jgi:uncharacterized membrane protein